MTTAPQLLWAAAGRPDPRRPILPASGRCYWCASLVLEACAVAKVISDTFTDQDQARARSSPWLCLPCTWAMTGRPPDTLRLWSLAYREDGRPWPANHAVAPQLGDRTHAQNKADPSAFRALLLDPPQTGPWVCSVADSGQIHVLPFAPVNVGAGRIGVRYERSTVWTTTDEYRRIDRVVTGLLAAGASKQDITGEPHPSRLLAIGLDRWREAMAQLRPHRGGTLLSLVLFLSRKDKSDGDGQRPDDPPRCSAGASDDALGEQRQDPPDRVVEPSQERAGSGGDEQRQLLLVGLEDGAQTPDRGALHRDEQRPAVPRRGGRR